MRAKSLVFPVSRSPDDSPVLRKGNFQTNVPRAIAEFENAMQSFPTKKVLYRAVFRGKGLEFDSYRDFAQDDDADMIDWKASLRANNLLAKKYIEERDLNVFFLVDVSNSMLFGSDKRLKAEYITELVAALSHLIISSGDRVGLVMFNNGIVKVLHPSSSKNQFALLIKHLMDPSFYGGGFDLNAAIEHVLRTVKSEYTTFILISDFIQTRKTSARALRLMGSRFETMAIIVRDPMDETLPDTGYQFSIQDPYSGKQMILDPAIAAEKYHHNALLQKARMKDIFKKSRVDFLDLMTNKQFAIPVSTFLKSRALGGS